MIIEIGDTGPGIPPEVMERLYQPFVTTKPVGIGTGLGLSICHRLVTELGGEISAQTSGCGTVFRISLVAGSVEPTAAAPVSRSGVPVRRGKILVVDDEAMIAKAVQRTLSMHDVTAEHGARPALDRLLAGERFDVILCDLMMPDMSGMEFHAELTRQLPDQAKAIAFLTGGAFTEDARAFFEAVPNPRIDKPFEAEQLRDLIAQILEDGALP